MIYSAAMRLVTAAASLGMLLAAPCVGAAQAPQPPGEPGEATSTALIVETQTIGIDPVVGRFVNRQLRLSAEALGYRALSTEVARQELLEVDAGYPPSMADFWRATHSSGAERGLFAVVWASQGRYVVQVRVASSDGTGPFYAKGDADAEALEAVVSGLVQEALPPPGQAPAPQAEPQRDAEREAEKGRRFFMSSEPDRPVRPRLLRFRLALSTDFAFGIARDDFYNQLVGVRLDYRFSKELALGAYLGYANLRGRDGRASSLLSYLQLDNRVPVAPGSTVAIPLRIGLGYLARNGGVLRLSAGIAVELSQRVELLFDLLAPTFWITPDKTLFSLNLGLELGVRF